MASELIITLNTNETQLVSFIGLDLKVISYLLIFQMILVIGINQPQTIFYRGLQTDWEQLQKLINNLNEGICIIDLQDQFQFSNPVADQIFGLSRGGLVKHYINDFISPDQQLLYTKQKIILKENQTNSYELEITQLNKETRLLLVTASQQILDGKQIGTFIIFRDITEREKEVEKIKNAQRLYQTLFMDAPIHIWENNYSLVKKEIDKLHKEDIKDFRVFFDTHPEIVKKLIRLVHISNYNNLVTEYFFSEKKPEGILTLDQILKEDSYPHFVNELVAIATNQTRINYEMTTWTTSGEAHYSIINWAVLPEFEDDYSRVLISADDITDQKNIQLTLQESEKKFRLLAENADVGINYYAISGKLIYLNDKAKKHYGRIDHDDIGKNIIEIFGQKWGKIGKSRIEQTAKSHDTLTFEDEIIIDNEKKWFTVHYTGILDNQDKCIGVQVISQDITNQKLLEKELQSLARFPQENPHPVLRLSQDGKIVYSNQSGKKILNHWENEEGSQFPKRIQKLVNASIKSNQPAIFEVNTGQNITSLFLTPIPDMDYANIYGRDITELKNLENELQSLARFPQENPNPVLRITKSGKVIYTNQGGEILLEKWASKKSQQIPDHILKIIKTSLSTNNPEIVEVQSGENIISLYITPIPDLNYINIYGRDVTDLKNAEAKLFDYSKDLEKIISKKTSELLQAQERLIRQERLATMGQLAGSVGHELRNPLAVINNAVFILNANIKKDNETFKQYLDIIDQEVAAANKIITDLLTFARIKPANLNLSNPQKLVNDVLEKFVPPDTVRIENKLVENLPTIYIDNQQIQQVIANLVINAYQAMPTGGQLTIAGSVIEGKVRLDFIDTGIGIPQENLEKIFEPLFTTKLKGIGLGLTVSKILAEINDGKIEVTSDGENGSTFSLFLPIIKDDQDIENLQNSM